jgi:O-antigen ligase
LGPQRAGFRGLHVLGFLALSGLGALGIFYQGVIFIFLAALAAAGVSWWIIVRLHRMGLEIWQGLLLFALTGYMLLNYGFENIALHVGGTPIIVSYALMYTCLALAVYSSRGWLAKALTEPAVLCLAAMFVLAMFHLLVDIPSYGLMAIRDCTMLLDGVFLVLGMLWAAKADNVALLIKWLMLITVVNLIYSFTFPWSEKLLAWSPASGVFMEVPILGQYHTTDIYLLTGVVLCLGSAGYMVTRKRWIMLLLAMLQLLGLAITQARASYVALAALIVLFVLIGEGKRSGILVGMLVSALAVLALATGVGGIQLSGRIGPVNVNFLADHLRSITGEKVTAASTVESRVDWTAEAMAHFYTSPIVGVGFGQALINYIDDETGAVVRYPHNSNITILARLGVIGFGLWLLFHFCVIKRFIYAYSRRKQIDKQLYELILWIVAVYITVMIAALVEAPFEFPSSAIPFYFFTGLALGLIRWRLPEQGKEILSARPAPALAGRP